MCNSKLEKRYDVHIYDYEILNLTDSSFTLKTSYGKEYYFKDIKLLPNRISKFESLELKLLTPWRSNREIKMDNEGNYYDKITFIPFKSRRFKRKKKVINEELTKEELSDFIQKLTAYYALYLPAKRNCGIDSERSDFYIKLNEVTIKSEGCDLNWLHYDLLEYLLNFRNTEHNN